jgi:hypothetical protein
MKKFKDFLSEEMMPYAQTEKGFVGVDNGPVRDNINIHLASVTARPHATPYHAMEMIRKVLAPFSIFPPQTNFLDGDSGHEVFQINQFGDKMGMTNDGTVVVKNFDPYYVYFEYQMNDMGSFDIFCEIVTEDELEEIMSDVEDEMEDGETTDGDEADAEDSFDEYKAGNDLKEETLNELRGKSSLSKKEREELKRRIRDKHSKAWDKTQNIRKTKKSFGPSKDTKDIDSFRNRLGGIYNKLEKEKVDESNLALALGTLAGIVPAIAGLQSGLIQKGVRKASSMTSNLKKHIGNMIANKKAKKVKTEK